MAKLFEKIYLFLKRMLSGKCIKCGGEEILGEEQPFIGTFVSVCSDCGHKRYIGI